ELSFRGAPPDTCQFNALHEAIEMSSRLTDGYYTPSQIPEDFPESHRLGIDRMPARGFVGAEEILSNSEAAYRHRIIAKAPRSHAHPSEVFHRISKMRELPIENGANSFVAEYHVADSIVTVDQGSPRCPGDARKQPSERKLEGGMRLQRKSPKTVLVSENLGKRCVLSRLSQKIQLMLDWVDLVDSRENFGKLARHYRAGAGVIGVAEQSARDRLTLNQSHHKEGGAEHGFVF